MVDARGYLCPMPVVMVQNAIKKDNPAALEVLVDNETAVENIKRFAAHSGYQAAAREDGADYHLTLTKKLAIRKTKSREIPMGHSEFHDFSDFCSTSADAAADGKP